MDQEKLLRRITVEFADGRIEEIPRGIALGYEDVGNDEVSVTFYGSIMSAGELCIGIRALIQLAEMLGVDWGDDE